MRVKVCLCLKMILGIKRLVGAKKEGEAEK